MRGVCRGEHDSGFLILGVENLEKDAAVLQWRLGAAQPCSCWQEGRISDKNPKAHCWAHKIAPKASLLVAISISVTVE